MDKDELIALLNTKLSEVAECIDTDTSRAVALLNDLTTIILADREKVVADKLTEVKKNPKVLDRNIEASQAKKADLEASIVYTEEVK